VSSGPDTLPDRNAEGEGISRKESVRQTEVKMVGMTGVKKTEDDECLCYTGVQNCVSHRHNTVCFVIQEESEPSSGSVHSCAQEQIEKTVKCDLIIKYNKKVKVVKKSPRVKLGEGDILNSNLDNETSKLLLSRKMHADAKNSDSVIPEIISKDENSDSGTESVNETKDSIILKRKFVLRDKSVA
jgi:hypothetical protein